MKKNICIIILMVLHIQFAKSQQRFWISPASVRADFWEMFSPTAKWDTLLNKIDVFSIHVNAFSGSRLDTNSINNAINKLNKAGVLINFECGGLRPFSGCDSLAGERQAQFELANMYKWVSRGGKIDIITMDSPINTMIKGGDKSGTCDWTVERTAYEIADYMKAVKTYLPNVKFAIVEPIPWYHVGNLPSYPGNDFGDLIKTLDIVFTVIESRGEKIEIFHSDSPYEYSNDPATPGWQKIKAIEDWLHTRGIRHGRINNSSLGGEQSSKLFYDNTINSSLAYKNIGGNPDEIEVWCWYPYPDKNIPESEPYTFTYTCKQLFDLALHPQQRKLLEPLDGYVYHGVQLETYDTGPDPIAGYLGALNDSTIQPAVHGFFFSIPGTRGPDNAFIGLKKFLKGADSIGFTPELSLFMTSDIATDSIVANTNKYDWIIDSIISISKSYGKSMFLRIGGEFNGKGPGWNGGGYHPNEYVTMFRKIVNMYKSRGLRDSVATIWCYEPDAANDFDSINTKGALWYPGDDVVDWFGLDVFDADHFDQSLPDFFRGSITKKGKSERFLSMARTKSRPVYMSETSAKGVNISADLTDGMNDWNNWFAKFWAFIAAHKEIKGFSYIDANWPIGAYPNWGDARIENSAYITYKYKAEMKNPKYIHLKTKTSVPIIDTIPLTELGLGTWKNNTGGLYANGKNERPFIHDSAGVAIAKAIVPLDTLGNQDNTNGKIVLLSIGMSNATQEYSVFKTIADTFSLKNPKVTIVDGAQGGQTASIIKDPAANFWRVVNQRLSQQSVNPIQVQAVWFKEANANPTDPFPKHAQDLKSDMKAIVKILKIKYPNLKLVYISSRIYAGYATTTLNPEPYAYESGFSVKWLVDEQINGDTALVYSGNKVNAPWLSWGPYLWAKGTTPRQDGLVWLPTDLGPDGTHPSDAGRLKVAKMLLNFYSTDSSTVPWFIKKNSITSTKNNADNYSYETIELDQNHPNPFCNSTLIKWKSKIAGDTKLSIFDLLGHEVYNLLNEKRPEGEYEIQFNHGALQPGIYFYKIQIGKLTAAKKMVLLE